jgi:hypothetical protein
MVSSLREIHVVATTYKGASASSSVTADGFLAAVPQSTEHRRADS